MTFRPVLTSPVGTPRAGSFGRLSTPTRIIVHHTVTDMPANNSHPYHFLVHRNGTIRFGVSVQDISGGTRNNNTNSIQIAAEGNWHDNNNMTAAQITAITNLIVDCLRSYPTIPRMNRFNLNEANMRHFGNASRETLSASFRQHNLAGISGHTDGLNEATNCPGIHFYRRLRDSIVLNAIFTADNMP